MIFRQTDFFQKDRSLKPNRVTHGGSIGRGHRKIARPLDRKRPVHLVLKSNEAKGQYSLLAPKNRLFVEQTIRNRSKQFGVTIQAYENMGNHIHMITKFSNREGFQNFLRTVTAVIARFVTGARRGRPFGRRFWEKLAFTRIVCGYRDLQRLQNYMTKNSVERSFGAEAREIIERLEAKRRKLWAAAQRQIFKD